MKLFLIYSIDCKTNNITIKDSFYAKEDALLNVEKLVLNIIKDLEGTKQTEIALQNSKSVEQILNDVSLKEGHYIRNDADNHAELYEKKTIIDTGLIYNSTRLVMEKKSVFGITEIDVSDKMPQCICNMPSTQTIRTNTNNTLQSAFVDELKNLFCTGDIKFGLKPIGTKIPKKQYSKQIIINTRLGKFDDFDNESNDSNETNETNETNEDEVNNDTESDFDDDIEMKDYTKDDSLEYMPLIDFSENENENEN
jgi:hypothetical protein